MGIVGIEPTTPALEAGGLPLAYIPLFFEEPVIFKCFYLLMHKTTLMADIDKVLTDAFGINDELTKLAQQTYADTQNLSHKETMDIFFNGIGGTAGEWDNGINLVPQPFYGKNYLYCNFELDGRTFLYVVASHDDARVLDAEPVVFNCSWDEALEHADPDWLDDT